MEWVTGCGELNITNQMNNMYKYLITIAVLGVAFFVVGRCTAPAPYITRANELDSLNRRIQAANNREIALRKAAAASYAAGLATQLQKPKIVVRYIHDTAALHHYSKHVRDSLARVLLAGNSRDSSEFTFEAVNGALDLGAKVEMLKSESALDSAAIKDFKLAYLQSDSAHCACKAGKIALAEEVVILKKEVKRQKGLKWLFGAVGILIGKVI